MQIIQLIMPFLKSYFSKLVFKKIVEGALKQPLFLRKDKALVFQFENLLQY